LNLTGRTRLVIAAGTTNPSKLAGIREAFNELLGVSIKVFPVAVNSGVPPQPLGINEILLGAKNRCLQAFSAIKDADFGVGVEAGIYRVEDRYYDVQVAVVRDSHGLMSVGFSPSFQVPPPFAEALVNGEAEELEVVVDKYFGTKDIGEKGGLIKILTKGVVTREHLTRDAVLMALIPWVNKELYKR